MKFGDWARLLAANGFRVRPNRLPKAVFATLFSLVQTPVALPVGVFLPTHLVLRLSFRASRNTLEVDVEPRASLVC